MITHSIWAVLSDEVNIPTHCCHENSSSKAGIKVFLNFTCIYHILLYPLNKRTYARYNSWNIGLRFQTADPGDEAYAQEEGTGAVCVGGCFFVGLTIGFP